VNVHTEFHPPQDESELFTFRHCMALSDFAPLHGALSQLLNSTSISPHQRTLVTSLIESLDSYDIPF
jgi:hypothetical protein